MKNLFEIESKVKRPLTHNVGDIIRLTKSCSDLKFFKSYMRKYPEKKIMNNRLVMVMDSDYDENDKQIISVTPYKSRRYLKDFYDISAEDAVPHYIAKYNYVFDYIKDNSKEYRNIVGNSFKVSVHLLFYLQNTLNSKDKIYLCQGKVRSVINGKSKIFYHSWIEYKRIVLDYSQGYKRVIPIKEFHLKRKIKKYKIYEFKKVVKLLKRFKHFGNWHK